MRIAIPPLVIRACNNLSEHGYQAYLVGGAIRDSYLGLSPIDWDIATDATPTQVESIFSRTIPTGKDFGTITVVYEGSPLEITTMRKDGPYSDGRHPDYITFTDEIEEDLGRRDFTINALAYDPLQHKTIDPFSGLKHIKRKLLATVGEPDHRFREDPLRMLRLLRFQSTLGFRIQKKTRLALPGLARSILAVSVERVLGELNKMLLGSHLFTSLETFYLSGLMEQVLPELAACYSVSPGQSHPYDLLGHAMTAAHFAYPALHIRWAALLHDVGKLQTLKREHAKISAEVAEGILRRLRASSELVESVSTLISHHMFSVHPHSSEREVRRFLAAVSPDTAFDLIRLRQADMAGMNLDPRQILSFGESLEMRFHEVLAQNHALSIDSLAIDGHDLMQTLSLQPGPLIGEILRYLLEQVLADPSLNQRSTLESLGREYLESLPENPTLN
ncbi:MAG: HD domain-containing protein [Firmicutes bacterium]|nr:HD domain-containing protein [Bacillota bacterium]